MRATRFCYEAGKWSSGAAPADTPDDVDEGGKLLRVQHRLDLRRLNAQVLREPSAED